MAFFFFFLLFASSLFLFLRSATFRRVRLPPGTLGLPLIGETLHLISAYKTENPEPFIDERVRRFGPVFTTHLFGEPTVFSADLETNRFILQNEEKLFECSYPGSISNLLGKHSLLLMKGSLHKRMHSLTTSFANSSIIRDRLLVDVDRLIRLNLQSWTGRIFLMEEAKKITFELAVKQLMSFDRCEWTQNLMKEYLLVIEGFFTVPLPLFSTTYRRAIQARRKVAEQLGTVVRQRREESEGGVKKKDMLGALLAGEHSLSDEQIVDFLLALLVAGYETTSTTMTLAVKFLTETPLALAQLQEEQEIIKGRKKESEQQLLQWNDYKSMPFTQCVVNETLRVGNIISGVFRRAITDVNIKGAYTIPKGWRVFASFRAVHLNHRHFSDARSFNPWRWQQQVQSVKSQSSIYFAIPYFISATEQTSSGSTTNPFTPFGGGPRLCPGYELARVELSVFLHHLVTQFRWVPAEDDKLVFFPTTRTQKRYPIYVTRRDETTRCKDTHL